MTREEAVLREELQNLCQHWFKKTGLQCREPRGRCWEHDGYVEPAPVKVKAPDPPAPASESEQESLF